MAPQPHSNLAPNLSIQPYDPAQYIQTNMTGNRVSRKCHIMGSSNIILGGKCVIHHHVIVRGDLKKAASAMPPLAADATEAQQRAAQKGSQIVVSIGRHSILGEGCIIRPPYKAYKGAFSYYPIKIGDHVIIGAGSILEAAVVGSCVDIGRNVIIGKFAVIKDGVRILDNSVLAPGQVVISGTVWGGSPAKCLGELSENFMVIHEARTKDYYARFRPGPAAVTEK
ncbi:Dynactin, subunit p25 [Ceraceosorus bombacis]|uniref:Dynactin subunit 5 n=1 Tax=Ceraceosorus bombacis TaxID=401625 RepID=A0A0P1B9Q2_9BASI|nr:Dynactin, subunit p25 [Ceraceosorus bombacis]